MRFCLASIAGLLLAASGFAQPNGEPTPQQQLARDIFQQLIEINTTDSVGDNTKAAEAMAMRFRAAGYPEADIHLLGPAPRKGNLVVRLHGTGPARPVLFIGHLDVVEAKRSDWSVDPFQFIEKEGYFYGRGTSDMKGDDAILVTSFLRLKREGYQPARDMILALTSDEEGGSSNGMDWLVKNHRDLIDAEFCVNSDGGGGVIKNGSKVYMGVQAAEKVFLSFKLEVRNAGGHSSLPKKDNAIYHLADGLSRLSKFDFPVRLFDVTRTEFERAAPLYAGQLGADLKAVGAHPDDPEVIARLSALPLYNALLRTTCVATMLSAGHAENALPQSATAVINCRLIPVDNADDVEATLRHVLADPAIEITVMTPAKISKYMPMNQTVLAAVTAATTRFWPGLPIVPLMTTGASDGVYLNSRGIPTYGVSGVFGDEDDVRAHGRDERVMVKSFYDAVDFIYDLAARLGKS
ncbi:MAG TPA: M20/M25/M40 family metallo-hydrolase [Bryobacteraceae bacterium]|jgi:acetylornithine deacetylase/succinyl-diaminopimelate desuccinylase-like protein|nr:M20/M25/M40 family metallo-hydrolase [Bryobacteraceae bacterium]